MMHMKARYLTIVALLITLSLAAVHAPLLAQDSPAPAATEDPCTTSIDAAMATQDATGPVATEDPALDSCLETLSTTVMDMSNPTGVSTRVPIMPAATEAVAPATEPATPDSLYIPITIIRSNNLADAGRVWVTWHDQTTGALTVTLGAYGLRLSYYNMGLDVTIPANVLNIGIRIETSPDRSSGKWQINPTCTFTFAQSPQGFSVTIDDNNVCTGAIDNATATAP